jgi:hypothetical protein
MAQGLEIYDSSGNVLITYTTYVGCFLGSFSTGASTGSFTNAGLVGRSLLLFNPASSGTNYGGPNITFDSSTGKVTWTYTMTVTNLTADSYPTETIYYGAY